MAATPRSAYAPAYLRTAADACRLFAPGFVDRDDHGFQAAHVAADNRLLALQHLPREGDRLPIRPLIARALAVSADGLILACRGTASAHTDHARAIAAAARPFALSLVDVLIADGEWTSFRALGLL